MTVSRLKNRLNVVYLYSIMLKVKNMKRLILTFALIIAANTTFANSDKTSQTERGSRYAGNITAGHNISNDLYVNILTAHAYKVNDFFLIGAQTGVIQSIMNKVTTSMPVMGYFRVNFNRKRVTTFTQAAAGYNVNLKSHTDIQYNYLKSRNNSGFIFNQSLGFEANRIVWLFGYSVQRTKDETLFFSTTYDRYKVSKDFKFGLTGSVGVRF